MILYEKVIKNLLLLCFAFTQCYSFAQNPHLRDSLQKFLKTAPQDSNKVNALIELSHQFVQYDLEKAESAAKEAVRISQILKFPKGEAQALLVSSRVKRQKSNYAEALSQTFLAINIFEKINDQEGSAKCYFELGYIYKYLEDYPKSINAFSKASALYKTLKNEKNNALCETVLGHVNTDIGLKLNDSSYYKKALIHYNEVLSYYKKINNRERICVALLNLANLQLSFNKSFPSEKNLTKSLEYSTQALEISRQLDDVLRIGINLENIGEVHYERKQYEKALEYYFEANTYLEKSGNIDYILENLYSITNIFKNIGDYNRALEYAKKHGDLALSEKYNSSLCDHYKILADIYTAQKNPEKAYQARLLYENYKDSTLNEEKAFALLKLEVEYETRQKDKEIALLNQERALKEIKLNQQQTSRNFFIATTILVVVLLLGLFNRFRFKQKQHLIINEKNIELEKLSIVARETANGVFITDAGGNIEWFNEGFSKLFGWESIEEYKKSRGSNIIDVSGNKDINLLIEKSIRSKASVTYENDTPDKNGNSLWIKTTLSPVFDKHGNLQKMIFVETDVTELKKAKETAIQSLQIQEQFLANTSHEIRTPMNGVLGMIRQLQETPLNHEQTEFIQAIKESSNNLLHVVNDILDISKIRAGKITFEKIDFRLPDLFRSLLFMLQYKAEEKGIYLKSDIGKNIPSVLKGDPIRLNQVLLNLASNAIKFTENGGVTISCTLVRTEGNTNIIQFCIIDTGIGIPEEKLDYIFETFAQAETHTTRKYGGTGLGLSISKFIVEQQGGTIEVNSEIGKGSSFCFTLGFETGDPEWKGNIIQQIEGIPVNVDLSHIHVLLVEDNLINQRVAVHELSKWKTNTDVANNANEAFEKLTVQQAQGKKYNLILMDISMPGMDGLEATRKIRADFPAPANQTSIVAMTASALAGEKEKCYEAGMNDYLSKPFDPVVLYTKLLKWGQGENAQLLETQTGTQEKTNAKNKATDLSTLLENAAGDIVYIREMIEIYLQSMPEYLNELNFYFKQKNWLEVKRHAHKMRSPTTYFGAHELSDLLYRVEIYTSRNSSTGLFTTAVQRVNDLCLETFKELEEELKKLG
ncbi:MAG: ATP-binding protein [Bacteroidota bacterium]|nr:ATP-binding protein [Bacteroidota bacterium]